MRRLRPVISPAFAAVAMSLASCVTLFEPDRAARAPTLEGFGALAMTISTPVPAAQQGFTQGLLQTYAFNDPEAARAFKAALAQDPDCAMCAWGVAHALGPNINAPEREDLTEARRYIALAQRHLDRATPRERALVEAMAARYAVGGAQAADAPTLAAICGSGAGRNKADPLDLVYAARMRAIADAYPDDPDVLTLYAEAVMIATRVDWWDRRTGAPAGEIGVVAQRLERVLAQNTDHTGLNHYLIHAVDQSPAPQRATAAADRLGALAPQSPHLLHMPAHIYVHTARYADAERVNESALAAELRQTAKLAAQGFDASRNWDFHNVHFLWYAALMEGHGDVALAQARRLAERAAEGKSVDAEFLRALPLLTLLRLERWDEVLQAPPLNGDAGLATGLREQARGVAFVRTGRLAEAQAAAVAVQSGLDSPALAGKTVFGDDPARTVLEILALRLRGEIALAKGDAGAAADALRGAVDQEAALDANEPPLLGDSSRLALGSLMLRARRWADAEAAFRQDLTDHPGSGWALRGLQQALAAQGKADAARGTQAELMRAWSSADASLRTAREL